MSVDLITRKFYCKNKILQNNKQIASLSKENERLFKSLMTMVETLPQHQKDRYDKELASNNWKKYSKNQ